MPGSPDDVVQANLVLEAKLEPFEGLPLGRRQLATEEHKRSSTPLSPNSHGKTLNRRQRLEKDDSASMKN